jgi:transposase InsO family protein
MKQFFAVAPVIKYEIIHEMTSRDDNLLNITWLCELAGVSRSGYYYWVGECKTREQRIALEEADFALILEAFKYKGYDKGVKGIHMRLLHLNPPVVMNTKKIRRLMRKFGLQCPIRRANPYRKMAKAMQTSKIAPNILDRHFRAAGARRVLLTDITYIQRNNYTGKGADKFSYLSVIMDAYTKEVLAWVCSYSLDIDFVLETVCQLLEKHGGELETDTLIHSDQGCHYTSNKFIDIIKNSSLRQSMSRRGNCWDNAPQESFFGHMKDEVHLNKSDGHTEITKKIGEWIEYYNSERPQWNLRKLTPREYYEYSKTSTYPLAIPVPTEKVSPSKKKKIPDAKCNAKTDTSVDSQVIGGSAPVPPEFNALNLQSDVKKTSDNL